MEGEKERAKDKKKGEEENDDQSYAQQGTVFLLYNQVKNINDLVTLTLLIL